MCSLQLVRCGQHNVVLMRDMTDTMYNPAKPPFVSHFEGNRLFRDYVEEFVRSQRDPRFSFGTVPKMRACDWQVCPTVTSDSVLAEESEPFEFAGVGEASALLEEAKALTMEQMLARRLF